LKLAMTGLDYRRSSLDIREKFALTTEKTKRLLADFRGNGISGCVMVCTCNRTELYASISTPAQRDFSLSSKLCNALGVDFSEYQPYLTERTGEAVMEHLCRVASGLDSQITGDDQVITQVREALELSRGQKCTDSYIEAMFNMAIHAAKAIKTNVLSGALGASSVPEKTVEELSKKAEIAGKNALVIGSGTIGRHVAGLLIRENARVTITLRSHQRHNDTKGSAIPPSAHTISYDERYQAVENADIVVSATTSPHLTLSYAEMSVLKRLPALMVDLAVPRDIEPSIKNLPGVTLLTIDDISGETRRFPPQSVSIIEGIIAEHKDRYSRWVDFKEKMG